MAEETTEKSEGWIWIAGAVIVLAVLSQAVDSNSSIFGNEPSSVSNEAENPIVEPSLVGDNLEDSFGSTDRVDGIRLESGRNFSRLGDQFVNWLASFSLLTGFPSYVLLATILTFLSLIIIIYSQLRQAWIMVQWDKDIGFGDDEELNVLQRGVRRVSKYVQHHDLNEIQGDVSDKLPGTIETEFPDSSSPASAEVQHNIILDDEVITPQEQRWQKIIEATNSDDESVWRQAVIEADILLDELLTSLNYEGKTVAEKLQQIRPIDMNSLGDAWTAHKVRNQIAHEGSQFHLSKDLFLKTVAQFERVFQEWRLI